MKKIILSIIIISFTIIGFAQHFIPLKMLIYPDSLSMAFYGGLSLDKGNGPKALGISNTGQTGFVVNALYRKKGKIRSYHQFMIDLNPIITNWDPFTWNKLVNQPIDSFMLYKVPYSEDAVLHIGWRYNLLSKIFGTKIKTEFTFFNLFSDLYYRPYKLVDTANNLYRFSALNVNLGSQFSYVQKQVPVLGNFLIGLSLQANALFINEPPENIGDFKTITGLTEKIYFGPGGKIIVQTNNMNIYMEMREYYGKNQEKKFTPDATFLVGIMGNLQWTTKRAKRNPVNVQDDGWM